ncbi:mitogen-activated protein kinase kinase kinase YODA-like [Tripterygium wilfordii]|uniref:Mitogen-activated protein kinase kinase kinase YODA-like n=1 Tax=Tripterygium wilfordii TaxID=458696 RepID=A0A7J7CPX4_TRIWF|nr:mitogen-activated protein kinase kinase kinase 18 [Tripterygium wilfordii]KAF5736155.1 mitogen-activated protein kinase kinase kinase YODA-like [Tripterygium wilfordii]
MEWVRGEAIGHGSFATVHLAKSSSSSYQYPSVMAVKSCDVVDSDSLKNEKEVLGVLRNCPQIIRCYGDDYSTENGERLYNLFLEYANRGSLANQLKKAGGCLPESDVRHYTRSILQGLQHIHSSGFAHCDIKLQNLLLFDNGAVKIADFGLAKKSGEKQSRGQIRGTPLYLSPESVNENEYESPADVWALGCAVVEMVTGKNAWNCGPEANVFKLLIRIGTGDELPVIPDELSEEGKDFLGKCFVKDHRERWTAEMLLNHPFVAASEDFIVVNDYTTEDSIQLQLSPRCPFDFPDWVSVSDSLVSSPEINLCFDYLPNPAERVRELASRYTISSDWSFPGSWVNVR